MADELIDILNIKGEFTGEIQLKSKAHESGLWHASAQIWIVTKEGKVLLQKRATDKDTYPNLWDISVAGHLSAGDTPVLAALREIEEEIGLILKEKDLIFLKKIRSRKQPNIHVIDNEFNFLFLVRHPIVISELILQDTEVAAVKLFSVNELELDLATNYQVYVPHGMEYYSYIINAIRKLL